MPKVGGIGKVTERVLREVWAVQTVGDLYDRRVDLLHALTPKLAAFLFRIGLAIDNDDEKEVCIVNLFQKRKLITTVSLSLSHRKDHEKREFIMTTTEYKIFFCQVPSD